MRLWLPDKSGGFQALHPLYTSFQKNKRTAPIPNRPDIVVVKAKLALLCASVIVKYFLVSGRFMAESTKN